MVLLICLLVIFVSIFAFLALMACMGKSTNVDTENSVLSTKDGLYRKNPNKGYVTPIEAMILGKEKAMEAIDINKINVESFGRRRGAFGKFGYCVTNPICVVNLANGGLKRYISNLCKDGSSMERFMATEAFSVSIFDKPVYKVSIVIRSNHQEVVLYFIDSSYENIDELPEGFSNYSLNVMEKNASKTVEKTTAKFSLKGDRSRIGNSYTLMAFESSINKEVEIKSIWKR